MTTLDAAELLDEISAAQDFTELEIRTLHAARHLSFADGATLVLREAESCFYVAEDSIAPLWAGQRFPVTECISGWAMLNRAQTLVPDIEHDERIPLEAYRPTFVRSLVMTPLPVAEDGLPFGVVGVYWSQIDPAVAPSTLAELAAVADAAGAAVARLGLDAAPWAPNFALRPSG